MSTTTITDYMKLVYQYNLYIPIDHEYEIVIDKYPIVPLIWFTLENNNWKKYTLLCIPDDNSGYSQDMFMDKLKHAYQEKQHWPATRIVYENVKNIRSIPTWTYLQLRARLWFIEFEQIYYFRYIFHTVDGIIQDATIVVDEHPVHGKEFEILDVTEQEIWEMSPIVDNGKTMKRNLEEMFNLLNRIRYGKEQETIKVIQPKMKTIINIGYDDDYSETTY